MSLFFLYDNAIVSIMNGGEMFSVQFYIALGDSKCVEASTLEKLESEMSNKEPTKLGQ